MIPFAASALECIVNGEENPFPPIGDAAYRKHAGGGPSHGHRQHAQKLVKIACVVLEISCWWDRQTDRHTHHNTSQLAVMAQTCQATRSTQIICRWSETICYSLKRERLLARQQSITNEHFYPVYTIQPVVNPVSQPVRQQVVSVSYTHLTLPTIYSV